MAELCLKVLDGNYKTLAVSRGEGEACIVFSQEYKEGDMILFEASQQGTHIWLQLDDALGKSLVYVTGMAAYQIPFGNKRINLSPSIFGYEAPDLCKRGKRLRGGSIPQSCRQCMRPERGAQYFSACAGECGDKGRSCVCSPECD